MIRKLLPCLLFSGALSLTGILADGAKSLTPEMLVDLQSVKAAAIDPRGERIAYVVEIPRAVDDDPGASFRELWVAGPGESPRQFAGSRRRVSDPLWTPDGKRISFLAEAGDGEDEPRRIHVIPADGGGSRPLFEHAGSISRHRWSPDGSRIAFIAKDAETEQEKADKQAGKDWRVWDQNPDFHRLWLFEVATGAARLLVEADLDVSDLAWSPDGQAVFLTAAESPRIDDEYMDSKLYRASLGGETQVVVPTEGKLGSMAVSPDGRHLAWLGAVSLNDPLEQSLFVVSLSAGEKRNLTSNYEGSATDVAWIDDSTLLLVAGERERHAMFRVTLADGARQELSWPRLIVDDLSLHGASGRLAVVANSPEHPSELFRFSLSGGAPERATRSNPGLDDIELARQETVEWKAADGTEISGVLVYPLDYVEKRRYPLVLQVHGGPEGTSTDGWTSSPLYPVQVLAAEGYAVLQPNYRGSGGRGVRFSKADHDDLGGAEFDDILAGIDALAARGLIDPKRVGTGGWSYGGYMSAWAATRHSERFRASVVAAGLTNWIAFAGTTDIPYEMSIVHWNNWWFDHDELHWQRSPLAHLNQARTPTLIVHGEQDERVHPEQGLELYTGLRIKKVPTQLVFYPREEHGLQERAHRLDFIERVVGWFNRYLE